VGDNTTRSVVNGEESARSGAHGYKVARAKRAGAKVAEVPVNKSGLKVPELVRKQKELLRESNS
jgi:hypothetical protein